MTGQDRGGASMFSPLPKSILEIPEGIENVPPDVQDAGWPRPSPAFDAGRAVTECFCTGVLYEESA